MKLLLALSLTLSLASCTGGNDLGECIGIIAEEDPSLKYELSIRNTAWSAIGAEMILPPVLWATHYAKCPVEYKQPIKPTTIHQGK